MRRIFASDEHRVTTGESRSAVRSLQATVSVPSFPCGTIECAGYISLAALVQEPRPSAWPSLISSQSRTWTLTISTGWRLIRRSRYPARCAIGSLSCGRGCRSPVAGCYPAPRSTGLSLSRLCTILSSISGLIPRSAWSGCVSASGPVMAHVSRQGATWQYRALSSLPGRRPTTRPDVSNEAALRMKNGLPDNVLLSFD